MNINKLLKIGRASDWWEYKIPPLLAIAYATIIKNDSSFVEMIPHLLFLLLALGLGAVYAYTINDLTDIEEDKAAGKSNQMAKISRKYRWMVPLGFFLGGFSLFCVFVYRGDYLSGFIYGLPCVCFSLYSFRPFRLKERGVWGVLADALGAHFFLSLLMVSSLSFTANVPIDWLWFALVGAWSLVFGIRGILWHQFHDRENDLQSNTKTFATTTEISHIKKQELLIVSAELILFIGILIIINMTILFLLAIGYFLFTVFRYRLMGYIPVLITNPKKVAHIQILMLDFYLVFFPIGILLYGTSIQPMVWIIICIQTLTFNNKLSNIIKDMYSMCKLSFTKRI